MPVVFPTRVVENRIETDAMHGNTGVNSAQHFPANIGQPDGAGAILGAGFRDENGSPIAAPDLQKNFMEGTVSRIIPLHRHVCHMNPLVAVIEIYADDVEILRLSAKFVREFS